MTFNDNIYVTKSYSPERFQLLLENHLKTKHSEDFLSQEFLEECISAYLEVQNKNEKSVKTMKNLLKNLNLADKYSDCRDFSEQDIPLNEKKFYDDSCLEAVKCFVELVQSYICKSRE